MLLLHGCSGHKGDTTADRATARNLLLFGNLSEPQDIDPHLVTGIPEHHIMSTLFEGLVTPDPKTLAPVPGVAQSWQVSGDGLRYTFALRPDAKWSNGDSVTAADFVFAFNRILSPKLASPYAYMLFAIKGAEAFNKGTITDFTGVSVRASAPLVLDIELESPTPYFLSLLTHFAFYPVNAAAIRAGGDPFDRANSWTRPGRFVGNGAFTLQVWESGKRIVVERSTNYWDRAAVALEGVAFYPTGDAMTEERMFRAGQLHVTGTVPIDRIKHYREQQPELLRLDPYFGTYYYLFNVSRKPLDDRRVRRALSLAINRDEIAQLVVKGGEEPAERFTPPGVAGYTTKERLRCDPEEARKLLADAGFAGGAGFPTLKLLYNTSDAHERIALAVQQMWKLNLGINIELENMEWKVYLEATQSRNYDIARAGWIGDYLDPNSFLDLWMTGGGNNRTGWSDAAYDALIRQAARTVEPLERLRVLASAEDLLLEQSPIVPIYSYRSKALVQPSVKGWSANPLDQHPFKYLSLQTP
jgi:oligopeptide transport system substrate-binding protein